MKELNGERIIFSCASIYIAGVARQRIQTEESRSKAAWRRALRVQRATCDLKIVSSMGGRAFDREEFTDEDLC